MGENKQQAILLCSYFMHLGMKAFLVAGECLCACVCDTYSIVSIFSPSCNTHSPPIHLSFNTHSTPIHHPFTSHSPLIQHPFTPHSPLIHHSFNTHPPLIHLSFTTHSTLIYHPCTSHSPPMHLPITTHAQGTTVERGKSIFVLLDESEDGGGWFLWDASRPERFACNSSNCPLSNIGALLSSTNVSVVEMVVGDPPSIISSIHHFIHPSSHPSIISSIHHLIHPSSHPSIISSIHHLIHPSSHPSIISSIHHFIH